MELAPSVHIAGHLRVVFSGTSLVDFQRAVELCAELFSAFRPNKAKIIVH
jgi:hypothetical protein